MSICETQKIAKTDQKLAPASRAPFRLSAVFIAFVLPALAGGLLAMSTAVDQPDIVRTPDPVESLAFSSDGTVLAAGFDGRARLIHIPPAGGQSTANGAAGASRQSTERYPLLGSFQGAACALRWPGFSPTSLIYYGRRRDCAGGIPRRHFRAGNSNGNAGALRPESIPLYDLATGRVAKRLGPHPGYLTALGMSADGERLASASDDGQVRIWSVNDGRLLRSLRLPRLTDPRRPQRPFAFDPGLELLAVHDWRDYYMLMIELETGRVLHKTEYPFRAVDQPLFVFAPDGGSYFDGRRIRATRSGEPVSTIEFNFALAPRRAAFSPDGRRLALLQAGASAGGAGQNSTVEIYTVATGALYSSYTVADRLESLAWHPEAGRALLAVGGYSGRVYLRAFESLP